MTLKQLDTLTDFHRAATAKAIAAVNAGLPPHQMPSPTHRTTFNDLTGQRFTRWTVIAEAPRRAPGQSKWHCRCDCGTEKPAIHYTSLVSGRSKSCGCRKRQLSQKPLHEQHGHVNPTYRSWYARRRLMCFQWRDNFDQFLADMGPRPAGMRLVSMDGRRWDKDNCEWRVD